MHHRTKPSLGRVLANKSTNVYNQAPYSFDMTPRDFFLYYVKFTISKKGFRVDWGPNRKFAERAECHALNRLRKMYRELG